MKEPELCSHTEVRHCQKAKLLKHKLPRQLDLNGCRREEVLEGQGSNLHYVSNIEGVDPFILVQVAQNVLHVSIAHLDNSSTAQPAICFLLSLLDYTGTGQLLNVLDIRVLLWQRPSDRDSTLLLSDVVLNGDLLQDGLKYWEQLHSCLFQQAVGVVMYETDFFNWLLLDQFLGVVAAQTLTVVDEEVRYLDCLVGVYGSVLVLVHLREEGTDLHMRFTFVLQHL